MIFFAITSQNINAKHFLFDQIKLFYEIKLFDEMKFTIKKLRRKRPEFFIL